MGEHKDTRIAYGARCLWWDSIDQVGKTPPFRRGSLQPPATPGGPARYVNEGTGPLSPGLPCCPHCKGLLLEVPDMDSWMSSVRKHDANGNPGYVVFVEWLRGRCFKTMLEAKAAYTADTGQVPSW